MLMDKMKVEPTHIKLEHVERRFESFGGLVLVWALTRHLPSFAHVQASAVSDNAAFCKLIREFRAGPVTIAGLVRSYFAVSSGALKCTQVDERH
jgi:hypothetical protein